MRALFLGSSVFAFLLLRAAPVHAADWRSQLRKMLTHGALYVERKDGAEVISYRPDEQLIPASTLKLCTAYAALETFGPDYRFSTDFYSTPDGALLVKGLGSPSLVSEELRLIAKFIAPKMKRIRGIVLDTSFVSASAEEGDYRVDGASDSTNPYDAVNGALVANFNTVFVTKDRAGRISSAEPQTPLTPIAEKVGRGLPIGTTRVNLGKDPSVGARYFAELLTVFLREEGAAVEGGITFRIKAASDTLLYTHRSAGTLRDAVTSMLDFSTNFLANQLILLLGAKRFDPPASIEKGARALSEVLRDRVGLKYVAIFEGAGLSRKNRFSPREMVSLLRAFEPYANLLPLERKLFRAKTGSLTGVSSLAGYFTTAKGTPVRFAILVNGPVPHDYKFTVAKFLYDGLNKDGL